MITMTTTQHRGTMPGRALAASGLGVHATPLPSMRSWQGGSVAPAFLGCDTTGVAAFPTNAYVVNHTTQASAKGFITSKRTARSLGARST